MNFIMSDCTLSLDSLTCTNQDTVIDLSSLHISPCIGCFGCWVKTPGSCVIPDDAHKVYPLLAKSENVLYVTELCLGCYSPVMKRMLERSIPIQQAFLRMHHDEIHHVPRNTLPKHAVIVAYGNDNPQEQELFRRLVARNALNMMFSDWKVVFTDKEHLEDVVKSEVSQWKKS